ncbi:(2Fe-2S) ferredoxin domain-containing protein [Lihuaxuella thermophila]|uniref:(2Fe-2S) ferredoxin n=1 Tax=Lihuaxuella thermophila TaxID=1173111 RepID=A0A1H8JB36_9BACL|nr:(2Fe-2S) ferredoxin domain-containing protein [Lihuaxuella thermophila]SEN77635.1 (2Fe-2S) ferredoxin [Lihuaxuella thermophila]
MELTGVKKHLLICNGATCVKNGGKEVAKRMRAEIYKQGLSEEVHTTLTLCNGRCEEGAIVISYPDGNWYKKMTPELGAELVQKLFNQQLLEDQLAYIYNDLMFVRKDKVVKN